MKKYEKIFEDIKMLIEGGSLRPGFKIPTELELMNEYNVSRITAQKAINMLVSLGMVYRIPGKGSFVTVPKIAPETTGQNMQYVTVIVPYNGHDMMEVISGIEDELSHNGIRLVLGITNGDVNKERNLIMNALDSGSAGLIIYPIEGMNNKDLYIRLLAEEYPLVILDKPPFETFCTLVSSNSFSGAFAITEYLIHKGHKDIAFSGYHLTYSQTGKFRYSGFCEAMRKHNLKVREEYVIDSDDFLMGIWGLLTKQRPTALFCFNDLMAIDAIKIAKELGLSVPEDISIVGFDDNILSEKFLPALTTVRQDYVQQGLVAGRLMKEKLLENSRVQTQIYLPVDFVERESVRDISHDADNVMTKQEFLKT